MSGSPTGGGVAPGGSDTQVQVNSQGIALYADSGFTYSANASVNIRTDMKMIFDSNESSDTYFSYNSSNDYFEMYVDGSLRAQF